MSIWTKLFGASDFVDMVKNTGDAVVFTNEEKAKQYLDVLKHIEPFKVAQRWFALIIITPYVLVWLLCAFLFALAACFDPGAVCIPNTETICQISKAQQLMDLSDKLAQRNNDNLGTPVALIAGFYFGGGMLEGAIGKFKQR